jgi:hypothetical protein
MPIWMTPYSVKEGKKCLGPPSWKIHWGQPLLIISYGVKGLYKSLYPCWKMHPLDLRGPCPLTLSIALLQKSLAMGHPR